MAISMMQREGLKTLEGGPVLCGRNEHHVGATPEVWRRMKALGYVSEWLGQWSITDWGRVELAYHKVR